MAKYTNEDQLNLEQLLEEGFLDRLKARGAGALGSLQGVGDKLKGVGQQALGKSLSKFDSDTAKSFGSELSKSGQQNIRKGEVSGYNKKIEFLKGNIDKRIQSFVSEIKNDIKKLGLDIGNIEIVSGINDALNQLKKSVTVPTPPPLPQQRSQKPDIQQAVQPEPETVEDDDSSEKPEYSYPVRRKKKQTVVNQPAVNPKKGKVMRNPLAKYAAPEQEEDLDKMFWD